MTLGGWWYYVHPVRAVQPCNLKAVLAWVGMSSLVNKGLQHLSVWVMPSSFKTKVSGPRWVGIILQGFAKYSVNATHIPAQVHATFTIYSTHHPITNSQAWTKTVKSTLNCSFSQISPLRHQHLLSSHKCELDTTTVSEWVSGCLMAYQHKQATQCHTQ